MSHFGAYNGDFVTPCSGKDHDTRGMPASAVPLALRQRRPLIIPSILRNFGFMDIQEYKGSLEGKVVLITGAGGGIGLETAKCFAVMGAKVVMLDIDREKGVRAEAAVRSIPGAVADFYCIDLAEEGSFAAMKDFVIDRYGCPDIVFNNAAVLHLGALGEVGN